MLVTCGLRSLGSSSSSCDVWQSAAGLWHTQLACDAHSAAQHVRVSSGGATGGYLCAQAAAWCVQDYTWRNLLQFNPAEKKAGYSYADVVIAPMARAVNRAIK